MSNTLKKISAILMSVIMIVAMTVSSVMAGSHNLEAKPAATDTETVTVKGLKSGDKVTFYQIVKAEYGETGFEGYVINDKHSSASLTGKDSNNNEVVIYPSAEQLSELAKTPADIKFSGEAAAKFVDVAPNENGTVEQVLAAGEWLAVVTPADAKDIYNPMVVSVYYEENGSKITSGSVTASDSYSINGTTSYVKSSSTNVDKKITGGKANNYNNYNEEGAKSGTVDRTIASDSNNNGDDLAIGDSIDFEITSTIPAYSTEYVNPVFNVYDLMDAGLTLDKDSIKVYVGGTEVPTEKVAETYSIDKNGGEGYTFKVNFLQSYIESADVRTATAEARAVKVTYSATLNEKAKTNFDYNKNTATVEFTNKPGDNQKAEKITDETYQYTFEIDGSIGGNDKTRTHRTHELIKTGEGGSVVDGAIVDDGWSETTVTSPLADAVFTLTNNTTGKVYTATTDATGYMNFKGLDAGTYTLQETQAPDGYSLNSQKHTVKIEAFYNENGTLKSYSIEIDGKNTSTYEATYDSTNKDNITEIHEKAVQSTEIKNTKLNQLPSTGGIGTYLFTIIGVAIMAAAAAALSASRKRKVVK
ncbi:MAG: SpaA isopeptide-forming pilin-related protein [Lachnospiraceae bacterium]|nr:SpaA isopeptide-forming pilin-related protein [Lachnospiraceae bacterium]